MSKRTQGFTIVELSIAIAFLAVLLIAILTLTITAGRMYVKADTNKAINQVGRDIADTMRRDFLAIGMSKIAPVVNENSGVPTQASGRICLGGVAYVWNTADLLNATSVPANNIKIKNSDGTPVKFARITRPQSAYCTPDGSGRYITSIPNNESITELLSGDGLDYALHIIKFTPLAKTGEKGLYEVNYTLGTNQPGTTQTTGEGYIQCKPNNAVLANFDYCSVNDFDMIVRIGGVK